jgi:hypothetical protein
MLLDLRVSSIRAKLYSVSLCDLTIFILLYFYIIAISPYYRAIDLARVELNCSMSSR